MKCAKCGEEISPSQVRVTEDGQFICASCASRYYIMCSNCRRYILKSEDRRKCEVCNSYIYNNDINNYSLKPIPVFKNRNNLRGDLNNRYYGLEIEYSNVNPSFVHVMMEDLYNEKYIYNKSDSSLNNGVEIVTNPCDKSSLRELIKRMSPTLEEISKQKRYKTNAGIHIHVNRKSVSPIDIYKLSYLLNFSRDNNTEERKRLYFLCGRIRRFIDICDDHYFRVNGVDNMKELLLHESRYNALNLNNRDTIEFRLFKTTADPNIILSYIEIIDKILEFVHNNGLKDMTINNFLNYLYNNTDDRFLLSKLKVIKNKHSLPEYKEIDFTFNYDLLDGIDEEDYYDWLVVVTNSSYKDIIKKVDRYKRIKSKDYSTLGDKNLKLRQVKEIGNRLRKMYTEKIMKGIDLLCA